MAYTKNPSALQNLNLWSVVALLVLVVLLVISYKFKHFLKPNILVSAELDMSCDLRKAPCVSKLPNGGEITFSITPNTLPILRPLELEVTTKGLNASAVEVDLAGVDMDMGYNRPKLDIQKDGKFTGRAIIPVCVRARMDWEARVMIKTPKGVIMAPFRFYTEK